MDPGKPAVDHYSHDTRHTCLSVNSVHLLAECQKLSSDGATTSPRVSSMRPLFSANIAAGANYYSSRTVHALRFSLFINLRN